MRRALARDCRQLVQPHAKSLSSSLAGATTPRQAGPHYEQDSYSLIAASNHNRPFMTSQSKEVDAAAKRKSDAEALIGMLGPCVFLVVTGGQLLNQSRPALVLDICKGNQRQAAETLARLGGMGGAAEFLFNPLIGRLSDKFGRKPFLMLSPLVCMILRFLVFLNPSSLTMITFERMMSTAVVTGFFTSMRASLNDRLSGNELSVSGAQISTWAGMGVVLGPFIEAMLISRVGAKYSFMAVSALNLAVLTRFALTLTESLDDDKRKEIDWVACNPFSFITMFNLSGTIRTLMCILALQSFGEGRIMQDINMMFLGQHLKWSTTSIGYYTSIYGAGIIVGGWMLKWSLNKFGATGHTTISNIAMAISYYVRGFTTAPGYTSMYGGLLMSLFGQRKRDAVETICGDLAINHPDADMGKGQVAAALSNFKSLATIFGPPLSGASYSWGVQRGMPGTPFHVVATLYIAAELVFQTLSKADMGLDKDEEEKE